MVLRLFLQSLEGEARKWFKNLGNHSVTSWDDMENTFLRKWGEKKDYGQCLTEFNTLKKKHNEGVSEFIKRFNNLYLSLPPKMKPHETVAKIVFIAAFDFDFGFSLRERKPATLDDAQSDSLELESNFASTGKLKGKVEQDTRRKGKEEVSSSNQEKDSDKMDEISKMIKKMVKLELEAKSSAPKNFYNAPNRGYNPQYKRPPLQILPREAKEQQDQVPHPLYLEGPADDSTEDTAYQLEDSNLSFSNNDDIECPLQ